MGLAETEVQAGDEIFLDIRVSGFAGGEIAHAIEYTRGQLGGQVLARLAKLVAGDHAAVALVTEDPAQLGAFGEQQLGGADVAFVGLQGLELAELYLEPFVPVGAAEHRTGRAK